MADQILVLDNQGIVARGTHETLLKESSLYADIYRRQFTHEIQPIHGKGMEEEATEAVVN